jgi:pimeloyl-ACP methyl ester carboxylesterase
MPERFAQVPEDVKLCYETFGDRSDPPLLLVMGLGTQMLAWREEFCAQLVERGFHVIRFDNRDNGRSSRVKGRPPTARQLVLRDKRAARYSLSDMATDAIGLLDHLGIESAHVCGASMGGMIAQTIAIEHPERVRSLVSIMSTTGGRLVGQPALGLLPTFLSSAPRDRETYAEYTYTLFGRIGSPGFAHDEQEIKERARRAFDRGITSAGTGRQMAAILAARDRTAQLRELELPALVIHGDKDKLVKTSGGKATAKAIRECELLIIEGMGHDLPEGAWPQIIDGIVRTAWRAGEFRESAAAA